MPVRNLLSIIGACLVGAWFGFGVLERLNSIESDLRLMHKDLEAANTFIDSVPKGHGQSAGTGALHARGIPWRECRQTKRTDGSRDTYDIKE